MNISEIEQKLDYLDRNLIMSRSHDVYQLVRSVINGSREVKPIKKVGFGKSSRYIDRTEDCVKVFNFLKISHVLENSKKGKINLIIKIIE